MARHAVRNWAAFVGTGSKRLLPRASEGATGGYNAACCKDMRLLG